jgi:hypothetical protein
MLADDPAYILFGESSWWNKFGRSILANGCPKVELGSLVKAMVWPGLTLSISAPVRRSS